MRLACEEIRVLSSSVGEHFVIRFSTHLKSIPGTKLSHYILSVDNNIDPYTVRLSMEINNLYNVSL